MRSPSRWTSSNRPWRRSSSESRRSPSMNWWPSNVRRKRRPILSLKMCLNNLKKHISISNLYNGMNLAFSLRFTFQHSFLSIHLFFINLNFLKIRTESKQQSIIVYRAIRFPSPTERIIRTQLIFQFLKIDQIILGHTFQNY